MTKDKRQSPTEDDPASAVHQPQSDARRRLGQRGEQIAAGALRQRGYTIRETNWRCSDGEIDLVAEEGGDLVFVEVRTRRGEDLGTAEESVTPAKQTRLIALAERYYQEHTALPGDWRIDVVAIQLSPAGRLLRLNIIPHAVEMGHQPDRIDRTAGFG